MVRKLIAWALDNPLAVILGAVFLAMVGFYSFMNVNVEAYPDPAPAIVEVLALFPGASAEEVERQVTIPLEVTFSGMPGLKKINSKSLFGLSDLKMTWHYGSEYTYYTARQEVINRMATISQPLPPNVTPAISPESPTGEIFRYILKVPKDASGKEIYTLNDIKAMQDWVLEREFRRVPRVVDLTSFGGTVRRYEVQPDPDRLRRYGITLAQLQATLTNANATVGGDYITQGQVAMTVRSVGLFGGGLDPVNKVLAMKSPAAAAAILRAEELRRIQEIRSLVITSVNNQPIRVEDVVEGGRLLPGQLPGEQGVVVSNLTRLGRIGYYSADHERPSGSTLTLKDVGHDEDDKVQCIVLMWKDEDTMPALKDIKAKVAEINDPASGRLLPGTKIEPYYDRTDLLHLTTETVTENLCLGVALVVAILFMFVNNIKTAIIVAINIPLALLFAFTVLYLRGKSANLLSIGAVDFGIIVDSSVVVVENVYRNLASGNYPDLPLKERIKLFVHEIDHALLVFHPDHGVRLRAAVCHVRRGGTALPAHGADLRVLPGRRPGAVHDAVAGVVHAALQEFQAGPGEHARPCLEVPLLVETQALPQVSQDHLCRDGLLDRRHALLDPAARPRIHAGAGGGEPMAPRHRRAQHEPGALGGDRQAGAGHHGQLPRGGVDHHPERPARRRHGHRGLLQRRVLRAAAAPGGLAQGGAGDRLAAVDLWSPARADETRARRCDERRPGARHSRRDVELFAEHPRQCAGSDVRGQGGQFHQDLRPGHRQAGAAGRQGQAHLARHPGRRQRGHLPRPRRDAPAVPRRSGEVPEVGRDDGGRQQRRHHRHGRPAPVHHGRRREALRHRHPLAQVAAERRDVDPRHPGGHHQQPGGPGAGLGLHAQRGRACLAAARGGRQPGRHVQPDQQHPATPAPRPGHAGGQEPRPGAQRLVHRRRRRDHLPRERPPHDRHQVQRPRPRPGQRRRRGQGEDQGPLPGPLLSRSGAASSSRWRKPTAGSCGSSPCRSA